MVQLLEALAREEIMERKDLGWSACGMVIATLVFIRQRQERKLEVIKFFA
jgi:hypothetical protein